MATKLTRRLLAGYPNLAAHDPEGYIAAMIAVMAEYPEWAGQRLIIKVDEENVEFPPPVPKLRKWLDEAIAPYRFAQEWEARTKAQLQERKALEAPDSDQHQAAERDLAQTYDAKHFTGAVAKHGRPTGVFEADRQVPYKA